MIPHVVLLLLLAAPGPQSGQHASASGSLTVTAIVTSSVSVTFAPDGTPTIVVANAPADAATIVDVSSSLSERKSSPSSTNKKKASEKSTHKHKGAPHAPTY